MNTYHKINTIFKRDLKGNLLEGEYSTKEFEYLKNSKWRLTEKVDGTNIRLLFAKGGGSLIKGKTDKAQIPSFLQDALTDIVEKIKIPTIDFFQHAYNSGLVVCLYGEGYGNKIQKGAKYRKDNSFVLFDVKIGNYWLDFEVVQEFAKSAGLEIVPVLKEGTLIDAVSMARAGFNSQWGDFTAEGLVVRPLVEIYDKLGRRVITKIKYTDFK